MKTFLFNLSGNFPSALSFLLYCLLCDFEFGKGSGLMLLKARVGKGMSDNRFGRGLADRCLYACAYSFIVGHLLGTAR